MEPTFTPEKETPNQPPPGEQQMRTDNETRALNHKFYTNCMIAGLMLVTIVTAAYVLNKKSEREEALERKRIELQQALVLASLRDRKIPGISPQTLDSLWNPPLPGHSGITQTSDPWWTNLLPPSLGLIGIVDVLVRWRFGKKREKEAIKAELERLARINEVTGKHEQG